MIIVLVGSVYEDLLVKVQRYPKENVKTSAIELETRPGGNSYNTALYLTKEGVDKIMLITAVSSKASSKGMLEALNGIGIDTTHVVHREEVDKPSSSVIICSIETLSRTVISNNTVPSLTFGETKERLLQVLTNHRQIWIHFEGRNEDTTISTLHWLQQQQQQQRLQREKKEIKISMEFEKPERIESLAEAEALVDVSFYSQAWAQSKGFDTAEEFLRHSERGGRVKFCTWGEGPAAMYDGYKDVIYSYQPNLLSTEGASSTVGAGDVFIAAVINQMIIVKEITSDILRISCNAATNYCQENRQ